MAYKKFQSEQLFTGYELLDSHQVLITDDEGKIEDIIPGTDAGDDIQKLHGILSPGFINSHCHLELSHLKNVIPPGTGLIEFLCSVVTKRNFDPQLIQEEIVKAEKEMYDNGIVAVGDIGNTADTAEVKSKSSINWQNFVEVLSFTDEKADENITHYQSVLSTFNKIQNPNSKIQSSLVPHAPYSISPKTFQLINKLTKDRIISIHNQEHPAEDELYKTGGGDYLRLFKIFGVNGSPFPITGKSSIRSCLPYFNNGQTILLIHNTYMPEEDILWANDYANTKQLKLVYCFCPNANLYIENTLPQIELFMKHNCHLVLGTDSYSSNWQLSIAKEIEAVKRTRPSIPLITILQWATIYGAKALQWDNELGSFEKGKKPGVTLLDTTTWTSKKLI
ncbi:MAG TPA: amidohydrolase family protein [Chitinophagaceae bacterium]|jgi:cytosine/adenosine deaminase-related metal-dependent hydrolase|nr:amidohydrolase family protein [Chitinophagaceae bacterium]